MTTRERVLRLLIDSPQGLSGEVLASELGITRAAIWKTVRSLEEDGAQIESLRGQGYRLRTLPYNQLALSCLLPVPVCFYDDIDSTNSQARRLAGQGMKPPFVVVARTQSGGRGRRGRTFVSADGGIYMSLVVPASSYGNVETLTTRCALGVSDALSSLGFDSAIKWVNDIYLDGRKICGILIEHDTEDGFITRTIAGIGININQETFTSDAPNPVSLKNITGREYDTDSILSEYVRHLQGRFARISSADDIHNEFRDSLYRLNEPHRFEDESGIFTGRITDVEPHGALTVEREDGTRRAYLFKEIKYII